MNKHQVQGTIDDVAGRVKRQVGEWTGDTSAQVEGLGQQVKGKAEKAFGDAKEAVQEGQERLKAHAGQAKEQTSKAWDSTKSNVQKGMDQAKSKAKDVVEDAKDAAKQRQQADQMHDEGDLDPVYGTGQGVKGHGVLVTEEPQRPHR